MCLVARCSLSISKRAFLCACYSVCSWMCISIFTPLCLSVYIGVWLALLTSAHTFAHFHVCMSKIAPIAANVNVRHCMLLSTKMSYKASSTQNNAHPISLWHTRLYKTKKNTCKGVAYKKWDSKSFCSFPENCFVCWCCKRALANVEPMCLYWATIISNYFKKVQRVKFYPEEVS